MPTPESVAIREEQAIARIQEAAVTLKERTGVEFNQINLQVYMAPIERQAVVLEQIANILESLVGVLQEPIDPEVEAEQRRARMVARATDSESEQEEGEDASTEQGKRRPSPRRKT